MRVTDQPTGRELEARLDRLEKCVTDGFTTIDKRIDTLVTADMFRLAQRAAAQQNESAERRWSDARDQLTDRIKTIEHNRSEDRRMLVKTIAAALVGLLSIAATILVAIL